MQDHASPDDEDRELIARVAAGDRAAFAALCRRHGGSALRLARALTTNEATADDVLQEAFLAAFRHARTFRGESTVRAWLFTLTRNAAFHARKDVARREVPDTPLLELGLAAGFGDDPERAASLAEDRATLEAALATLPEEEREVLLLRDLEGLSGEETAQTLAIGVPAMKSRLHRARLRVMAALRKKEVGHARA